MLTRMREVGFNYIAFGVDGGNNKILEIVKKGETIETIEQAIKDACDLGYDVKLLFVVGTPYETREDVEDKVRLSKNAATCLTNLKMLAESNKKTLNEVEKILIHHFTEVLHRPPKMAKHVLEA